MRGRIRTVKPEALSDEDLWDFEVETGWPIYRAFQGLWMYADREGRFEWRPRPLKAAILPYWDGDFSRVLDAFVTRGFVRRYTVDGRDYGLVVNFLKHQTPNNREEPSKLPSPPDHEPEPTTIPPESTRDARVDDASGAREQPEGHAGQGEWERNGNGTERNGTLARARDSEPPDDRSPMERARSALSRGYGERYERGTAPAGATRGDPWMGSGANGHAIRECAAWCVAADPEHPERAAERLLVGMFADPWMREKRWPWGPVAKDPAKYASAGRSATVLDEAEARRVAAEAEHEAAIAASIEARQREAVAPPPDTLAAIAAIGGRRS